MRDLLTVIAALVIAVLTAAVAVPPLIDWPAHRDLIDRALSQALDAPTATEGGIEIRLLPSPRLKLERLRVGSTDSAATSLVASFVRAEIALAPLLSGTVRLQDARIDRAEIRFAASGGAWSLPGSLAAEMRGRRNWTIAGLSVRQLLVTTADPTTGRTDQANAENVRVQAEGLAGPWRLDGTSRGMPFQLATGELDAYDAASLKLVAGGGRDPRVDLDGRLQLRPDGASLVPALTGTAKLALALPVRGGSDPPGATVPVLATATIKASGGTAELDPVALDVGEGASSLRLAGTGRLALDAPRLALDLKGRRFDLDGFLRAVQGKAGADAALQLQVPSGRLPIDLVLHLDTLALAGEEWTGLASDASLSAGRITLRRFELSGPGESRLTASGELGLGFSAGGSGRIAVSSQQPQQLAGLLERAGLGQDLASLLDSNRLELSADVVAAEPVVSLRNLQLAFGRATLTGALRYTMAEGAGRARFDAQLGLQGFDLRRAPPPASLFTAARSVDLGLILDARNVSYGGARGTGRIAARLSSEGQAVRVDRLEIADLAGASGSMSGRIEPDGTGRIEGHFVAQRAAPLLDLAGQAWIGGLASLIPAGLRDSPLDLAVSAARANAANGQGLRTRLSGTFAGGPFEAETVSAGGELRQVQAQLSTERFRNWVGGPESAASARPARLTIAGAPLTSGHLGLKLDGDLAGIRVRTTRPIGVALADSAVASGALEIQTNDLSPLAIAVGEARLAPAPVPAQLALTLGREADGLRVGIRGRLAETGVTADLLSKTGSDLGGTVSLDRLSLPWIASALALNMKPGDAGSVWPAARFGPAPAGRFQGELAFKAAALELSGSLRGTNAGFTLASSPDGVALRGLALDLAGGHLAGEATLARQGGLASLVGGGTARDLDLAALMGGGSFGGRLSAELRFGGSGESVAGIVANLGGAGSLSLAQLRAARANPEAPLQSVARALKSDDPLSTPRVQAVAADELDRADLQLPVLAGPASLVAGVLRATPLRGDAGTASWSGGISVDLRSLSLDMRGSLQAKSPPAMWSGDPPSLLLGWQGPISRPMRTLDVAPLVNGLAAVVLTRELDRIDTFEADQNERQRRNAQRDMDRERRAAQEAARQTAMRAREAERVQAAERARAAQGASERPVPPGSMEPGPGVPPASDGPAQRPGASPGG